MSQFRGVVDQRRTVEGSTELHRLDGGRAVDDDVALLVLDRSAKAVHERQQREVALGIQAHADTHGVALGLEPAARREHVLPTAGPAADRIPQIRAVLDRVGDPKIGEPEVLLRPRVEDASLDEQRHLPDLGFDLVDDFPMIDDVVLERRNRRDVHVEEIVAPLRGDLRFGMSRLLIDVEVVDHHLDPIALPPALRVFLVEPTVVPGHVVVPLGNPQRPPALGAVRRPGRIRL